MKKIVTILFFLFVFLFYDCDTSKLRELENQMQYEIIMTSYTRGYFEGRLRGRQELLHYSITGEMDDDWYDKFVADSIKYGACVETISYN